MAKAFINDENLTDIADAIRATLDESRQYLPSEMAAAIQSVPIMAQLNRKKYFQAVPAGAASGYATIEQIEGNSVAFNQLASFNNSSETKYGLNITVSDDVVTITGTVGSNFPSSGYYEFTTNIYTLIAQHKYLTQLVPIRWNVNNNTFIFFRGFASAYANGLKDTQTQVILTASSAENKVRIYTTATTQIDIQFRLQLIDLTAIFGAGNEPTTVEEFEAWMAQNIGTLPYYDYNAGELLSVKMSGVKSVGFNQWDESMWAMGSQVDTYEHYLQAYSGTRGNPIHNDTLRFLPNTRYTIQYQLKQGTSNNARLTVYYTDGTLSDTGYNNTTTYQLIRFVTEARKTVDYISLSYGSSGWFYVKELMVCVGNNTSMAFEPYQSNLADIDVTTITGVNMATNVREVIFPNGMKQADIAGTVKDTLDLLSDTATVNVGSRAYQSGDESDTTVITDGTNTYYALTTPITYTDLQDSNGNPLNPRYKVEQGGTEQVLPVNTSTPTTVAPTLSTIYKKNI